MLSLTHVHSHCPPIDFGPFSVLPVPRRSTTVLISHWPSDKRRTGTIDFKVEVRTPARDHLFDGLEAIFPPGKTNNFNEENARLFE